MFSLLSEYQQAMSADFPQPNKRRRIEHRTAGFGLNFKQKVSRIVSKRKADVGERGGSDGENTRQQQLQAQRSLTEYFGWEAGTELEELAEFVEKAIGGSGGKVNSENGGAIGEQEGTEVESERQRDKESEIEGNIENQMQRHEELEGEMQQVQQCEIAPSVRESVDKNSYNDDCKGDSAEARGQGFDEGRDEGDDFEGRVYPWLKDIGNEHLPLSEEELGQDENHSEEDKGGYRDSSIHRNNVGHKLSVPVEDLDMMVRRLNRQEREERKARKEKRKMERRRAYMRDNSGESGRDREGLDKLFGRQAKKRQRSDSEDAGSSQCKKAKWHLATPERSSLDDSSSGQESSTRQHITQPALRQIQSPQRSLEYGLKPYNITPATSDTYVDLLNRTIQDCISHSIYSHSEDTPLESSYILGSYWASNEKSQFFDHLATKGRHDLPGIAKGVGTKSIVEVRAYLKALEEGLRDMRAHVKSLGISGEFSTTPGGDDVKMYGREGEALVSYEDIPAAVEISGELDTLLQEHAEYLEKEVLEAEVWLEKKKWGEKWRCDLSAEETEEVGKLDGNTVTHKGIGLIHTKTLVELSNCLFMHPIPSRNNKQLSEINGDNGKPAIRFTCVTDLQNLVVALTQKLVHASMFIAKNRIQSSLLGKTLAPSIRAADVKVAARVMGLGQEDVKRDFWVKWPRRAGVQVLDKKRKLMELEDVERQLSLRRGMWTKAAMEKREGEGNDDEEMDGITEGEEMHVDGDGDREMGEAPLPLHSNRAASHWEDLEGFKSGSSEDDEHVLEEEVHNRADLFDAIESAKVELELWEKFLPENIGPPKYLIQKLRDRVNAAHTSHLVHPSRAGCDGARSSGSPSTSNSDSNSDSLPYSDKSISTFASDSDISGCSTTPDTTPVPTTLIIAGQTQRAKRQQRKLQDWDEDWVDNYPYYAAWASRFKKAFMRPGDHDCAGEGNGDCSGDDDEVIETIRDKGGNQQGEGRKTTSATECDVVPPAPLKRPRGRPRKPKPIQLHRRPVGRPRLTDQQLLERANAKLIKKYRKTLGEGEPGIEEEDFLGKSGEKGADGDGDHVMCEVSLADGRRVSSRQRKVVSRVGMVSTTVAVALAKRMEMEEKGEEGDDESDGDIGREGDCYGDSNEEEGEEEDEDLRWGSQEE